MDGLNILDKIVEKAITEKIPVCDVTFAVLRKLRECKNSDSLVCDNRLYAPFGTIDMAFAAFSTAAAAVAVVCALSYYSVSTDFFEHLVYNIYSVSNLGFLSGV